ncbi:MAG: PD-(D/E)XK nuclease family transposase [Lachnospiraceae bacterium]|nr:PD-(D/E)XK nuclease family transposase [Candidatus Colinaster scatohippi]
MTKETEKKFYGMKNDYMFKAVLQENHEVLVNLVATLMGISEEEIVSCKISNPIKLGKSIDAKDCVLDIWCTGDVAFVTITKNISAPRIPLVKRKLVRGQIPRKCFQNSLI